MDPDDAHPRRRQSQPQEFRLGQLAARLESLVRIEQAKGIVMAEIGCTELPAFEILRAVSHGCNVPIRDVAAQLIARTARDTEPAPGSDLQSSGRRGDRAHALLDLLCSFAPEAELPGDPE